MVRTRVVRVHSSKLQDSMKHGFFKRKSKGAKRLTYKPIKKGGSSE